MLEDEGERALPPKWSRERERYRVLRCVYDRAGANCETEVTGYEIGTELGMAHEQLFQLLHELDRRGYLAYRGGGPRVCLTERGVEYLERLALRRRSIRDDPAAHD